jgi:predicted SnoaL-like aldol condensation-catalyzing enzyme
MSCLFKQCLHAVVEKAINDRMAYNIYKNVMEQKVARSFAQVVNFMYHGTAGSKGGDADVDYMRLVIFYGKCLITISGTFQR